MGKLTGKGFLEQGVFEFFYIPYLLLILVY